MKYFLIISLFLCGAFSQAADISATKPKNGMIQRWVSLPSSLAPWQQVELRARVTGYVKNITVDKGDTVQAGQLLAQIEIPELEADLIKNRAEVNAAEIEVKRLHDTQKKSPDLILPQAVDDAEAKLAIAKASEERANTLIAFAQIKAPFAGTVTARMVDQGAYVATGGGALFRLIDANTIRVQVPVIEMESALIRVGQDVEIKIDALASEVFKSKIARTSYVLDEASRTLLVEADLKNSGQRLRPGMFATARLAVEKHENAMLIPVSGLVKEKANAFVFRHVEGKAVKTAVKPGFNDGANVEISTLKPDDIILLPGTATLTDGQAVNAILQP